MAVVSCWFGTYFYFVKFPDALQSYFAQYGEVTDCIVMKNPQTGKSRGFGFVTFRDPSAVDIVLSAGKHSIDGRTVSIVNFINTILDTSNSTCQPPFTLFKGGQDSLSVYIL